MDLDRLYDSKPDAVWGQRGLQGASSAAGPVAGPLLLTLDLAAEAWSEITRTDGR